MELFKLEDQTVNVDPNEKGEDMINEAMDGIYEKSMENFKDSLLEKESALSERMLNIIMAVAEKNKESILSNTKAQNIFIDEVLRFIKDENVDLSDEEKLKGSISSIVNNVQSQFSEAA